MDNNDNENNNNKTHIKAAYIGAAGLIIVAIIGLFYPAAEIITKKLFKVDGTTTTESSNTAVEVSNPNTTIPSPTTTQPTTIKAENSSTDNTENDIDTAKNIFSLKCEEGDITIFSDNDCIANINENYITSHPFGSISESGLVVSGWYIQLYNDEFTLDVYVQCFINNKNEIKVQETKIAINNMLLDHEFQTANCIYSNNHAAIFFDGNKLPINIREATGIMIGVWHQEG